MKPYGCIYFCTEFHDLNKACPKDSFPLPHIDYIFDSTSGYAILFFMDGLSGYNQIKINLVNKEKTYFTTL